MFPTGQLKLLEEKYHVNYRPSKEGTASLSVTEDFPRFIDFVSLADCSATLPNASPLDSCIKEDMVKNQARLAKNHTS